MDLTTKPPASNARGPVSGADRFIAQFDRALRSVFGSTVGARHSPADAIPAPDLTADERRLSGQLMRVNHVGEVCAQALYQAQSIATRDAALADAFEAAARDERDHLNWTAKRLDELGSRVSLLNPAWYAGAFALGLVAGWIGDKTSLAFMAETENQVEWHLLGHLERLPASDTASRSIVEQMRDDEARHAAQALSAGGQELPRAVQALMRGAAKVMTSTARWI